MSKYDAEQNSRAFIMFIQHQRLQYPVSGYKGPSEYGEDDHWSHFHITKTRGPPWRSAWEPTWPMTKVPGRYGPIFQLAILGHATLSLAKVPEAAHILSFYPMGLKLSLFSLYRQWFPRYGMIFKISIFGHKTWPLTKGPEVAQILFFYHRGLKLSLFSLYWQQFPRYGPIFKISIFGAWNLAIGQSARSFKYTPYTTPGGRNWACFHSTGSGFWDTGQFSKLPYLGMKLVTVKRSRSCTYTLFQPQRVEFELLFALRAAVSVFSKYGQIFKVVIFGHEIWTLAKVPEVAHTLYKVPWVPNFTPFCFTYDHFQDIGNFSFSH